MVTPELLTFIKAELAKGVSRDTIITLLKQNRWMDVDINEAFNNISSPSRPVYTPPVQQPVQPAQPVKQVEQTVTQTQVSEPVIRPIIQQQPTRQMESTSSFTTTTKTTNPSMTMPHTEEVVHTESMYKPVSSLPMREPAFTPTTSVFEQPHSNKMKWIIGSIVLVILLLLGGAFAYAAGYIIPYEKMLFNSVDTTENFTTGKIDMSMKIDLSEMEQFKDMEDAPIPGLANVVDINLNGSIDMSDKEKNRSDMNMSIKSGTFEMGMNVRELDEVLYMNLTKAPNIGMITLQPFENKWAYFDYSKEALESNPVFGASALPLNALSDKKLTDEQVKKVDEIVAKHDKVFTITKSHLPKIIDGQVVAHFDFGLDVPETVSLVKELLEYMKTIDPDNEYGFSEVTEENIEELEKFMNEGFTNFRGEAWVGVLNQMPYKFVVNFNVQDPEDIEAGTAKVMMSVAYSDIGEPVVIEKPTDAKKIEDLVQEVMEQVMGGMFGGEGNVDTIIPPPESGPANPEDAQKMSIHSTMRAQAEIFYEASNSYKGFCGSKGQYGAYVMAITLPKGTEYKCMDSATAWASWSKLSDGKYVCVDSTGAINSKASLPKGTFCPAQ